MAVPAPVKPTNAMSFLIGATETPTTEMKCHGRRIALVPDIVWEDTETFCNEGGEAPGRTKRSTTLEVLQSFGAEGLWNTLQPLFGSLAYFKLDLAGNSTAAAGNVIVTGQLWVPPVKFIDAGVGKYTYDPIEFKCYGAPTFDDGSE